MKKGGPATEKSSISLDSFTVNTSTIITALLCVAHLSCYSIVQTFSVRMSWGVHIRLKTQGSSFLIVAPQ